MRELKFRAWDGQTMHYTSKEKTVWAGGSAASVNSDEIRRQIVSASNVMQYTGLKDKNGKEIYEGDILKYFLPGMDSDDEETEYIEEVEFSDGCFCVEAHTPVYACVDWNCEVIGNIYLNPELL